MKHITQMRGWLLTGFITLALSACGEGNVDGTGIDDEDPILSADLQLVKKCFAQAPTEVCGGADFNHDGFINYSDLVLMKSAIQFDLNSDGLVDIRDALDNLDISFLNNCLQSTTNECSSADFNHDLVVDDKDIASFQTAMKFDISQDGYVDLRDMSNIVVDYSLDFDILLNCLFDAPANDCARSDLNKDQLIDFSDIDEFVAAKKFDLNLDGIIDLTNDRNSDPADIYVNEDLKVLKDCYSMLTADIPACASADLTGDGIVDIADFLQFRSADSFDLDSNGFVDLRTTIYTQDLEFLGNCFTSVLEGDCIRADFNNDQVVDINDFLEFRGSNRFDLNGDHIVNLYGTSENTDFDILVKCVSQSSSQCLSADFNMDGVVNANDVEIFKLAEKYDLNRDGFVDLRVQFLLQSLDLQFIQNCFSNIVAVECSMADFNEDGNVDNNDLADFKASSLFDLNGDDIIDLHDTDTNADLNIMKDCYLKSTLEFPDCAIADFTGDNVVNMDDFLLFRAANKFDLNVDGFVDLRVPAT